MPADLFVTGIGRPGMTYLDDSWPCSQIRARVVQVPGQYLAPGAFPEIPSPVPASRSLKNFAPEILLKRKR